MRLYLHSDAVFWIASWIRRPVAYFASRLWVGRVPLVPYFRPGDPRVADVIRELAGAHAAVLLANHGPVVCGESLEAAVYATEELEETARLFLSLYDKPIRPLEEEQIEESDGCWAPLGEGKALMLKFAANLSLMYNEHAFLDRFAAAARPTASRGSSFSSPMTIRPKRSVVGSTTTA